MERIELSVGPLDYDDVGSGAPLVFVHGAFTNARHWRRVVPRLAEEFRCVVPTWPLGAHRTAMRPEADLSPPALAALVAEFLDALELEDVTLVGNDTGTAVVQLVAARHPARVGRIVLVSGDVLEHFPPKIARPLVRLAPVPGFLPALGHAVLRARPLARLPFTFGRLARQPHPPELLREYLEPPLRDRAVLRDLRKLIAGFDARHTLEAAEELRRFEKPALLVWPARDRVFPIEAARRLAATMPDARLEEVEDSYTYVPEDQPERLAQLVAAFARTPAAV